MRRGQTSRVPPRFMGVMILSLGFVSSSRADPPAQNQPAPPAKKAAPTQPTAPAIPAQALLKSDAWKNVPATPLEPGEIDRLLDKEFQINKIVSSPLTTDEQFLRRIRLDLTGQLPTVAEIDAFLADPDPAKRAKWIDQLLASDDYARHWARYWRETVMAVEAPFGDAHAPAFEAWLYDQFKQNRPWGDMVRAMLTAEGSLRKKDKEPNGVLFFVGRHTGPDGDIFRTAETARLFLGIQLQCAQCHNDRRTHIWKQFQFHEMAGFFARMTAGGSAGELIKVGAKPNGEHRMPSKDAKAGVVTYPRFLDGRTPPANASDHDRRQALADYLTAPDNYWFSAAYVNRLWNELLGQSFYERVDDLSPGSEVVFPAVASRLAAAFRGSNYDTKALMRAIVASRAYQRQVRVGEAVTQHLHFTAVYPTRLRAEVLWQALGGVFGRMPVDTTSLPAFLAEFAFDPSLKADEVTGSIPQALWLLNSSVVNDRIKAGDIRTVERPDAKGPPKARTDPSLLKQLLAKHGADDPAILRALYLRTLARKPTDREVQTCLHYLQETKQRAGTRTEAFEDILKALINTTEFQRKR